MKRNDKIIGKTLEAVSEGRIFVENILDAACAHDPSFVDWLKAELRNAGKREPRLHHLYALDKYNPKTLERVLAAVNKKFSSYKNIVYIQWGTNLIKGHDKGQLALVFYVRQKKKKVAPGEMIPSIFKTKIDNKVHQFPTDVQAIMKAEEHDGILFPTAAMPTQVKSEKEYGTLSAVFAAKDQSLGQALVSGHITAKEQERIEFLDGQTWRKLGLVKHRTVTRELDVAIVDGVASEDIKKLSRPYQQVRRLQPYELGIAVELYPLSKSGLKVNANIENTSTPVYFSRSDRWMDGVIRLYGRITEAGDSGAPVYDTKNNIIGFVLGADPADQADPKFTYVLPAWRVLPC